MWLRALICNLTDAGTSVPSGGVLAPPLIYYDALPLLMLSLTDSEFSMSCSFNHWLYFYPSTWCVVSATNHRDWLRKLHIGPIGISHPAYSSDLNRMTDSVHFQGTFLRNQSHMIELTDWFIEIHPSSLSGPHAALQMGHNFPSSKYGIIRSWWKRLQSRLWSAFVYWKTWTQCDRAISLNRIRHLSPLNST